MNTIMKELVPIEPKDGPMRHALSRDLLLGMDQTQLRIPADIAERHGIEQFWNPQNHGEIDRPTPRPLPKKEQSRESYWIAWQKETLSSYLERDEKLIPLVTGQKEELPKKLEGYVIANKGMGEDNICIDVCPPSYPVENLYDWHKGQLELKGYGVVPVWHLDYVGADMEGGLIDVVCGWRIKHVKRDE